MTKGEGMASRKVSWLKDALDTSDSCADTERMTADGWYRRREECQWKTVIPCQYSLQVPLRTALPAGRAPSGWEKLVQLAARKTNRQS
jgi:hypothetical protein